MPLPNQTQFNGLQLRLELVKLIMNKCIKQYLEQKLLATDCKLGRRERTLKKKKQPLPPCLWSLKNTQVLSALKWRVVFVHVEGSLALLSVL